MASNFLDQIESHYDVINFEGSTEVKAYIIHFVNYIKAEQFYADTEPLKAIQVCQEGIKEIRKK